MSGWRKYLIESKRYFVGEYLPMICTHPNGGYLTDKGWGHPVCFYCEREY